MPNLTESSNGSASKESSIYMATTPHPGARSKASAAPKKSLVPRVVAAVAAIALSFGAALAVAQPSNAATDLTVTSGTSSWNIKDSWFGYILYSPPAGTVSPGISSTNATSDNNYDSATQVLTATLPDYAFVKTAHGIELYFKNVRLTLDFANHTGVVVADVSGSAAAVPTATDDVEIATLDLTEISAPSEAGSFTLSDVATVISDQVGAVVPTWSSYSGNSGADITLNFVLAAAESESASASAASPSATDEANESDSASEGASTSDPSESASTDSGESASAVASDSATATTDDDDDSELASTGASAGMFGVAGALMAAGIAMMAARRRLLK